MFMPIFEQPILRLANKKCSTDSYLLLRTRTVFPSLLAFFFS